MYMSYESRITYPSRVRILSSLHFLTHAFNGDKRDPPWARNILVKHGVRLLWLETLLDARVSTAISGIPLGPNKICMVATLCTQRRNCST